MCKKLVQLGLKARKTGKSSANHMIRSAKTLDKEFFNEYSIITKSGKFLRTSAYLGVLGLMGYVR